MRAGTFQTNRRISERTQIFKAQKLKLQNVIRTISILGVKECVGGEIKYCVRLNGRVESDQEGHSTSYKGENRHQMYVLQHI